MLKRILKSKNPEPREDVLENIDEIETVLLDYGIKINDNEVPSTVIHPRMTIVYSKFYKLKYLDEKEEVLQRKDALLQLEELDNTIKNIEKTLEGKKLDYMQSFRTSTMAAGTRLYDRITLTDGKRKDIQKKWNEEMEGIIHRKTNGHQYDEIKGTLARIIAAGTGFFLSGHYFEGVETEAALGTYILSGPLIDKWVGIKEKRINKKYKSEIDELELELRSEKAKIYVQTTLEVANELGRCITEAVTKFNPKDEEIIVSNAKKVKYKYQEKQ